jgi:diguanylate cyclase (GGDEF)-like protein/PAS domain S-box-containing protein
VDSVPRKRSRKAGGTARERIDLRNLTWKEADWGLVSKVLNAVDIFLVMLDFEGHIVRFNRSCELATGYTTDEVTGKNLWEMFSDPIEASTLQAGFTRSLSEPYHYPVESTVPCEGHWSVKDGESRLVAWSFGAVLDTQGKVVFVVGTGSDLSSHRDAEEHLRHRATHDALTDLPNRDLFRDRLSQALWRARRTRQPIAVILLDLDRFKLVNDTLGHVMGDVVLQIVAERLRRGLRKSDTVARMGGDEFTILLDSVQNAHDVMVVVRKVLDVLNEPYALEGHVFVLKASLGISMFPKDGEDVDTLLQRADAAMYRSKALLHHYHFYEVGDTIRVDAQNQGSGTSKDERTIPIK